MNNNLHLELRKILQYALDVFKTKLTYSSIDGQEIAGWHNFFVQDRVGTTGSALPLFLFDQVGEEPPEKEKIIKGLRLSQFSGHDGSRGGWAILSASGKPNVEGTALPLTALNRFANVSDRDVVFRGEDWLIRNQNENGGWGSDKDNDPRTLLTCASISSLNDISACTRENLTMGVNWLRKIQRRDGGWGIQEGADSTVFHTAKVLNIFHDVGLRENDPSIQQGLKHLRQFWLPQHNNNFLEEVYEIRDGLHYSRIVLDHDTDAEVVQLLLKLKPEWWYDRVHHVAAEFVESYRKNNSLKHPVKQVESIWTVVPRAKVIQTLLNTFPYEKDRDIYAARGVLVIALNGKRTFGSALATIVWDKVRNFIVQKKIFLWLTGAAGVFFLIFLYSLYKKGELTGKDILMSVMLPLALFILNFVFPRTK